MTVSNPVQWKMSLLTFDVLSQIPNAEWKAFEIAITAQCIPRSLLGKGAFMMNMGCGVHGMEPGSQVDSIYAEEGWGWGPGWGVLHKERDESHTNSSCSNFAPPSSFAGELSIHVLKGGKEGWELGTTLGCVLFTHRRHRFGLPTKIDLDVVRWLTLVPRELLLWFEKETNQKWLFPREWTKVEAFWAEILVLNACMMDKCGM